MISMRLKFKNIIRCKDKKAIKKIYFSSFPKEERMPFPLMIAMSYLWNTKFYCFYDGDSLCGFTYLAILFNQVFIMFFAVDENMRNKGYGSEILQLISEKYPKKKVIVSIEPCIVNSENYELASRRKNFYQRNGFQESGYMVKLLGIDQEVLIKNGIFNPTKFFLFFMLYSNLTMYPKIWEIKDANK